MIVITLCLKKSIGKYHSGLMVIPRKNIGFFPRSLRLLGRKSNIFPRDHHHPSWYFPILFFRQRVIHHCIVKLAGKSTKIPSKWNSLAKNDRRRRKWNILISTLLRPHDIKAPYRSKALNLPIYLTYLPTSR